MALLALDHDSPLPYTVMPPPGAVCPAMYTFFDTTTRDVMLIVPPTSNTTIRFACDTASRNEPVPVSLYHTARR
ncbi:putative pectate lyase C [Rosellinia necatrix]|uniref:Putative pectate lyase C n=1 Tax=Rosellinia necatrix TaxID=77044 RepID=A0A1S8A5P6_ROSNE|nr:putative pectate lyase C [Rosellinia necatrix]